MQLEFDFGDYDYGTKPTPTFQIKPRTFQFNLGRFSVRFEVKKR